MFKNYLLTAYKVYARRKLYTAINLLCIVITLVVLMVITAFFENAFRPSGVEGRSDRFLQVGMIQIQKPNTDWTENGPLGYKIVNDHLKSIPSARVVAVASNPQTVSVYQPGRVNNLALRRVDANYWRVLDFTLLAGRLPNAGDDTQGRAVLVVNRSTARQLFGAESLERVPGQRLSVGGQAFDVIGVVQDELHLNAYADAWAPITSYPTSDYRHEVLGDFNVLLMADSPAGLPAIRAEVLQAARNVQYADDRKGRITRFFADSKIDTFARVLTRNNTTEDSGAQGLLMGIVVFMLVFMLLPALNLVNLNMGRILERSSEIGVRKAFGATRWQLVGQLVLENILLCLAGGVIGLACAWGVLTAIEASGFIPYLRIHLNLAVFGWGLLITLVFGVVSGVIPAWRMSRMDPVFALKGAA